MLNRQAAFVAWLGLLAPATRTVASTDITAQLTANAGSNNVSLAGDAYTVTTAASSPIVYSGVMSGSGTLEITGNGSLDLKADSTYTLPTVSASVSSVFIPNNSPHYYNYEGYTSTGFIGSVYTIHDADPPAATIDSGATLQFGFNSDLQFGNDNATAVLGNIQNVTSNSINLDNLQDNGLLVVQGNNSNNLVAGEISGSGELYLQTGLLYLYGTSTLSGPINCANNMTLFLGTDHVASSIPNAKVVFNNGSFILNTPYTSSMTVAQNVYENHYGNDINIDGNGGLIVLSGVYSYSDAGTSMAQEASPSLKNAASNYTLQSGNASRRGINLEGGILQLGDGSSTNFFLPGNPYLTYINLHNGGILSFDYSNSGPTYINTPIAGGVIQTSLSTPGAGTVIFHQGHLVVTQQQYYNGITQIDSGATLQLGDGTTGDSQFNQIKNSNDTTGFSYQTSGGDGNLLQANQTVTVTDFSGVSGHSSTSAGTTANQIIDNGSIVIDNVGATLLSNVSGTGSLVQAGAGTTTLGPTISYSGATMIAGGTLLLATGSSLSNSSTVTLSAAGRASLVAGPASASNTNVAAVGAPVLDLSAAGNQTLPNLGGDSTAILQIGANTVILLCQVPTTYAGVIEDGGSAGGTGGSIVKTGSATLILSSANNYTGGTEVEAGTLELTAAAALGIGNVSVHNATLEESSLTQSDFIGNNATLSLSGSAIDELDYSGTDVVGALSLNGILQPSGTYGSAGSGALYTSSFFDGAGTITVVPEARPAAAVSAIALALLVWRKRRALV